MTTYKSRRRKLEEAVKADFVEFVGTALGTTQILMGREIGQQEPTGIRIHCNQQEPATDETEELLNFWVMGSITIQATADEETRDQISTLEGYVESYLEQDSETITASLNNGTAVSDFGCWDFQPESCEDGLDEENRRFISTYSFKAIVGHSTY